MRSFLIRASIAMIVLHAFFVVTKWNTTSDRLNTVIYWWPSPATSSLIALHPALAQWLTIADRDHPVLPLFASSILLPLTDIFYAELHQIRPHRQ